jgi:hypothetical protein
MSSVKTVTVTHAIGGHNNDDIKQIIDIKDKKYI